LNTLLLLAVAVEAAQFVAVAGLLVGIGRLLLESPLAAGHQPNTHLQLIAVPHTRLLLELVVLLALMMLPTVPPVVRLGATPFLQPSHLLVAAVAGPVTQLAG
jgi:hypothetical protein